MAVHSKLGAASSTTVGPAWLVRKPTLSLSIELGCFLWNTVLENRHQVLSLCGSYLSLQGHTVHLQQCGKVYEGP